MQAQRAELTESQKDASRADHSSEFRDAEFLQYLDDQGIDSAVVSFCGGAKGARQLYVEFMASPNFAGWLTRALDAAERLEEC